jgi:hypothetical protein
MSPNSRVEWDDGDNVSCFRILLPLTWAVDVQD